MFEIWNKLIKFFVKWTQSVRVKNYTLFYSFNMQKQRKTTKVGHPPRNNICLPCWFNTFICMLKNLESRKGKPIKYHNSFSMSFGSSHKSFFEESNFFEINLQENCTEPTKNCLFFNLEALSWVSLATDPAWTPDFLNMHIDVLNQTW